MTRTKENATIGGRGGVLAFEIGNEDQNQETKKKKVHKSKRKK